MIGIALLVLFTAIVLAVAVYWILLVFDKTEAAHQRLEKAKGMLDQERYGLLKRFATNTRHDLATPLTSIMSNVYLVRRSSNPAKRTAFLDRIEQETTRLMHILNQFDEWVRLNEVEVLQGTDIDLKNLVESALSKAEGLADQKGIKMRSELTTSLPPIWGDSTQLHAALTQLFDNAVRYSQAGEQIIVKLYPADRDEIVLDIVDLGPGIEPEKLAHLFDPQYKGSEARISNGSLGGFGLSIVKRIVNLHDGHINIESVQGQGTTVRLSFPPKL